MSDNHSTLASEKVIIQAPMSYTGGTLRIWKLTRSSDNALVRWLLLIPCAILAVLCAWVAISAWYLMFGLLLMPYRILRRGSRKRKKEALRHRETLAVISHEMTHRLTND